jgi:hypothetical protein
MLHMQDERLIMRDPNSPSNLQLLDLNTGKVIQDLALGDNIVRSFAPDSKYEQQQITQTFKGVSHNTVFTVDPRLSTFGKGGSTIVGDQSRSYTGKPGFCQLVTTGSGGIALASEKGELKLFDRLGIRAKTALVAMGKEIKGLDVSSDGRLLLATVSLILLF